MSLQVFLFQVFCYKKNKYLRLLVQPIKSIVLSASDTTFITATLHFDLFGLKPEKRENLSTAFITSVTDS